MTRPQGGKPPGPPPPAIPMLVGMDGLLRAPDLAPDLFPRRRVVRRDDGAGEAAARGARRALLEVLAEGGRVFGKGSDFYHFSAIWP